MSTPVRVSGESPGISAQSLPFRYQRAARKLVARDSRLSRRQKALLYALIDCIDGRLVARVSHAALAQDMGSSIDTVERAQRELVVSQMLDVTQRRRNGHQGPSDYRLPFRFSDLGANRLPIVSWEEDKLASLPEPLAADVASIPSGPPDPQNAPQQTREERDDRGFSDRDLQIPEPSIPACTVRQARWGGQDGRGAGSPGRHSLGEAICVDRLATSMSLGLAPSLIDWLHSQRGGLLPRWRPSSTTARLDVSW